MASIQERKYPSGSVVYRVRLKKKDTPVLNLTFQDYDEAIKWVVEHEPKFRKDPQKYFDLFSERKIYMKRVKTFQKLNGYAI